MIPEGYSIKSKRTRYGEYLFRSRLEAKWAVFMDLLEVDYKYEPECYEVETGCRVFKYIPDFFLPKIEYHLEIKPRAPIHGEYVKAAGCAKYCGEVILFSVLGPESGKRMYCDNDGRPTLSTLPYWWVECPRCLKIEINDGAVSCDCYKEEEFTSMYNGKLPDVDFTRTSNILNAFKIARNHTFGAHDRVNPLPRRASLY